MSHRLISVKFKIVMPRNNSTTTVKRSELQRTGWAVLSQTRLRNLRVNNKAIVNLNHTACFIETFHHFLWWYLWQKQYLLYDNYWTFNLKVWCYHWDKTRRKVTRVLNSNANNKTELVARLSPGGPGLFQWTITDHLHGIHLQVIWSEQEDKSLQIIKKVIDSKTWN